MERRLLSRHMVGISTEGRQSDQLNGAIHQRDRHFQVRHMSFGTGRNKGLMLRATFTIHDQPTMLLDYKRQQELLTAAKAHTGQSFTLHG